MVARRLAFPALVCLSFSALALPARAQARPRVDADGSIAAGTCQPSWAATFAPPPGFAGTAAALEAFDDGSGPALFVGGDFSSVGGVEANHIARWNGTSWAALASGLDGSVSALAVHDDGDGPALYAGGTFTAAGGGAANRIAKWDGASWTTLGGGMNGIVRALAVHDDGGGPALYAGGDFTSAGGGAANRVARWDGASWTALGSGMSGPVRALASYDDGTGAALYAGGGFTTADGVTVNRIAKWDGTAWTALGSGMSGGVADVLALEVFDDGSGPRLFAGGSFTLAGGISAKRIASWDGSSWATPGNGRNDTVQDLQVFDDGTGAALYVGGRFTNRLAKWSGSNWTLLGLIDTNEDVSVRLAVFDDGTGPALHTGWSFIHTFPSLDRCFLWRRDGSSWRALGRGLDGDVAALQVHDDGSGPALYAGGNFATAGGATPPNRIAKWNGSSWTALGNGVNNRVRALAVYDDGTGPALYAGGDFTSAGSVAAGHIAKWNGSAWSVLGSGTNGNVHALTVHDDGTGPALYAGGAFTTAGGVAAGVARWNGSSWVSFASRPDSGDIFALAWFDYGNGATLFAGGNFRGSAAAVAEWNGSSWMELGSGIAVTPFVDFSVSSLLVSSGAQGPRLYVGGYFDNAGGLALSNIASWDGSSWAALGAGVNANVITLASHDDGSGPALYAGGRFTTAGGTPASRIARWDGAHWSALESGMIHDSSVEALATFDDGGTRALVAGGSFTSALDSGDSYIASWVGCPDSVAPVLAVPAELVVLDLLGSDSRGPAGEIVFFSVIATDNLDPLPIVVCEPASGSFFPRGTTLVTCTATDATGNQSVAQFPLTVRTKAERR